MNEVSAELKIAGAIKDAFAVMPHGKECYFRIVRTMDEAAKEIDEFKSKTCGSPYDLALINLNKIQVEQELDLHLIQSMKY